MSQIKELIGDPRIVLDIGVGCGDIPTNPSMLRSVHGHALTRQFSGDRQYIGVDMPYDPNREVVDYFDFNSHWREKPDEAARGQIFNSFAKVQAEFRALRPGENIYFLVADSHTLPLRSGGVDEVFLGDVLGSDLTEDSKEKILAEAERVLKVGRNVVLHETVTPDQAGQFRYPLRALLGRSGLQEVYRVERGQAEYTELTSIYGTGLGDWDDPDRMYGNPFFAITQKL